MLDLAGALALHVLPGDLICVDGEMGSGKTVFCQGFVRALLSRGSQHPDKEDLSYITSPTYLLDNVYEFIDNKHSGQKTRVHHMDLFRLNSHNDARLYSQLNIADVFQHDISIVEWAVRLGSGKPTHRFIDVEISVEAATEVRTVRLESPDPAMQRRVLLPLRDHPTLTTAL